MIRVYTPKQMSIQEDYRLPYRVKSLKYIEWLYSQFSVTTGLNV